MFYKKKLFKSLSREIIRWFMAITIYSLGCTQAGALKNNYMEGSGSATIK